MNEGPAANPPVDLLPGEFLWDADAPSSGGSGHTIQDESLSLPQRSKLNFRGVLVTAADDQPSDATNVTIASPVVNESTGSSITNAMSQSASKAFATAQANAKVVNESTGSSFTAAMSQSAAKAFTTAQVNTRAKVTVSSTAPSSPAVGDIWVQT